MTAKKSSSPLADRLAELGVTPAELAAICGVDVETVKDWLADGPDAEAKIRLRPIFGDDAVAEAAVEAVRRPVFRTGRGYAPMNTFGSGGWA